MVCNTKFLEYFKSRPNLNYFSSHDPLAYPPIWFSSLMQKVKVKLLSHVRLFVTPWTVAHQAPLSMGFSRQEYWSGLPFPSPGNLPDPRIEPRSPTLQTGTLTSEPTGKPYAESLENKELQGSS